MRNIGQFLLSSANMEELLLFLWFYWELHTQTTINLHFQTLVISSYSLDPSGQHGLESLREPLFGSAARLEMKPNSESESTHQQICTC